MAPLLVICHRVQLHSSRVATRRQRVQASSKLLAVSGAIVFASVVAYLLLKALHAAELESQLNDSARAIWNAAVTIEVESEGLVMPTMGQVLSTLPARPTNPYQNRAMRPAVSDNDYLGDFSLVLQHPEGRDPEFDLIAYAPSRLGVEDGLDQQFLATEFDAWPRWIIARGVTPSQALHELRRMSGASR